MAGKVEQLTEAMGQMAIGDVLEYSRIEELQGYPVSFGRNLLYQAVKRIERDRHRTLVNVPKIGYRMAEPTEHEKIGLGHTRKSVRQLMKAQAKWRATDRSEVPAEVAQRLDYLETMTGRQQQAIRTLWQRQEKTEQVLDTVRQQTTDSAKENADLKERMERMEQMVERLFEKAA